MRTSVLLCVWLFSCSGAASANSCNEEVCQASDHDDKASMLQSRMKVNTNLNTDAFTGVDNEVVTKRKLSVNDVEGIIGSGREAGCPMATLCTSCDYSGSETRIGFGYSLESCKQKCIQDATCWGIDFGKNGRSGECYLNYNQCSGQCYGSHGDFDAWSKRCSEMCPQLYPECHSDGDCIIRGGSSPWSKAPTALTPPSTTYNFIDGYDASGTDCTADFQACALDVVVSGAESVRDTHMGTYTKRTIQGSENNGNRPIYANRNGKQLYYWVPSQAWIIGDDYDDAFGKLHANGKAYCPSHASGWEVWWDNAWQTTYAISIEEAASCGSWPSVAMYGCTSGGEGWKQLFSAHDLGQCSTACAARAAIQGALCCYSSAQHGCYIKVGAGVRSGSSGYSISCTTEA